MPPVLDSKKSKVDGLAFLGLSLCRKSEAGHPQSQTHQTAFDFNPVLDRDYEHVFSTNDDGWLVGGGEPGPPASYKLAAPDSAHVEVLRIGTYKEEWGGIPKDQIIQAFQEGKVLVPEIAVVPTSFVANLDVPPELEIRFDLESSYHNDDPEYPALPVNWQLKFLHNQLFRLFDYPSRFCPGAFHSTIVRKAEFRSLSHKQAYFEHCAEVVRRWRAHGPQALTPPVTKNIERVRLEPTPTQAGQLGSDPQYTSGLWLFTDRDHPTHLFEPNFLPPYNTPEKRKIIYDILSEEWNEKELTWQPAPPLPRPVPHPDDASKANKSKVMCGFDPLDMDILCGAQ